MRFALVHGYLGAPEDLAPLGRALEAVFGPDSVRTAALHPRWSGTGPAPGFDPEAFRAAVLEAAEGADVIVAHSTGGSLALQALDQLHPRLLVLVGTPPRVDLSHLPALQAALPPDVQPPTLLDLAQLVRTVNHARLPEAPPVLILQGDADALVPPADLRHWGPGARVVPMPGGHAVATGAVLEAILDALLPEATLTEAERQRLAHLEPSVAAHAERTPGGWRALGRSPSAQRALRPGTPLPPGLGPLAPPPVLANVEVTTRCPHRCPACARAFLPPDRGDLSLDAFHRLLDLLPHAARITLVGLGEPTLHPGLPDLVALAAGRAVGLVTSGAALTADLAGRLAEAGLGAVTFSLDAAEPELAARLRPGVPLARTLGAMKEAAAVFKGRVPLAVFTAVCTDNARHLDAIADQALALGARAWMLSDLNFAENQDRSLAGTADETDREAVQRSVARALASGLPALEVRGLEELGKPFRLREFLLRPADRLWSRSPAHGFCLSPWQTAAVGADGTLTACDCQPGEVVGNVFETPFQALWNGPVLQKLRMELLRGELRPACQGCPRL